MAKKTELLYRAGPAARETIRRKGLEPSVVRGLVGPASGPRWLVLTGIDRAIIASGLLAGGSEGGDETQPLLAGASAGGWRALAMGCPDPAAAHRELEDSYVGLVFHRGVTPAETSAAYHAMLDRLLTPARKVHVLSSASVDVALHVVRALGPAGSPRHGIQAATLLVAAGLNVLSARTMKLFFRRCLLHASPGRWRVGFDGEVAPLTEDNLLPAALSTGTVPLYMQAVRGLPGASGHRFLDGGLADYHLNQRYTNDTGGVILFPHFQERIVPNWFDRYLPWRAPPAAAVDHVLQIYPSPEFVAGLPGGRIPSRDDFLRLMDDPELRIRRWREASAMSERLGEHFLEDLESALIPDLNSEISTHEAFMEPSAQRASIASRGRDRLPPGAWCLVVWVCGWTLAGAPVLEADPAIAHDLMPAPVSVEILEGGFPLAGALTVAVVGPPNERIERALERLASRLSVRTGSPLPIDFVEDPGRASFVLHCPGTLARPFPSLEDDESYRLSVGARDIRLEAPGPPGVLRGLATLAQLAARAGEGWLLRGAEIEDAPRFPWRGLMIDVVRHWQPIEVIQRNLDAMEAVKLNVLHLHLTDDQGFRVESQVFPLLHERGSDGDYFSQEEIRHLIEYAADRGIRVVPEFDVPGHATSLFVAYPELQGTPDETVKLPRGLGMFHNALDPTREETYEFLDGLFGEMTGLFPDEFFHVGGDEVSSESWSDERVQAFADEHGLEGTRGLQAHFTKRVLEVVARHGKTAVGWDEMAHGELREDTVVQIWLPGADPGAARSLVSGGFYLDHMLSAGMYHANEPLDALPSGTPGASVLGGEACMWGEFVIPATIDSRIWPRAAAIAERLWSPPEVRDADDMYRRLSIVRSDLTRLGLQHDSYYEPALARLTGGEPSPSLRTLADVTTTPNILERIFSYEVLGAMFAPSLAGPAEVEVGSRFEDVLRPESETGRAFGKSVETYMESPDSVSRRAVEGSLQRWRGNHDGVVALFDRYPDLEEIEPVSLGLERLAEVGLSALEVLDGETLFTEREKRLHLEQLHLHDPSPLDLRAIEAPEGKEFVDALPEIIGGLLAEKVKTLEPLILFRVKIAVQPGIEKLVLAAHGKGTRDEGIMAAVWYVYDRKDVILAALAVVVLVALVVRRRRRKSSRP